MVENIKVNLGDYVITRNFYILPLGGLPYLMTGVQWLYTLGEITSNYKNLEMKLKVQGQEILL